MKVDNRIDLTAVCEAAGWHLATAIDGLAEKGIAVADARAFAAFAFNEHAIKNGGTVDQDSEDLVNDEQWDRLSI